MLRMMVILLWFGPKRFVYWRISVLDWFLIFFCVFLVVLGHLLNVRRFMMYMVMMFMVFARMIVATIFLDMFVAILLVVVVVMSMMGDAVWFMRGQVRIGALLLMVEQGDLTGWSIIFEHSVIGVLELLVVELLLPLCLLEEGLLISLDEVGVFLLRIQGFVSYGALILTVGMLRIDLVWVDGIICEGVLLSRIGNILVLQFIMSDEILETLSLR